MKHSHSTSRLDVPRETFTKVKQLSQSHRKALEEYVDLLMWWNDRINLVSRDVSRETVWKHVEHSLLLSFIPAFKENEFIVDSGTGGGLPGIPLAIAHPSKQFILNDIVTKKTTAVRQIAHKLGLENVQVVSGSIEEMPPQTPSLLVSKHAFKIDELWRMISPSDWSGLVFYKGSDFEGELTDLDKSVSVISHELEPHSSDSFYDGKAIVVVSTKS